MEGKERKLNTGETRNRAFERRGKGAGRRLLSMDSALLRSLTLIVVSLVMCLIASAANAAMLKGPYLIYPGDNTKMKVLWQLSATQTCTLEWGEDTSYSSGNVQSTEISDHRHQYTITGLTPGTKYYYRVTESQQHSGTFRSAPADVDVGNVKFFAYGDTRSVPNDHSKVISKIISAYNVDPDCQTFTLHSGDWVNRDEEGDWQDQYFSRSHPKLMEFQANMPINGCLGNHCYRRDWTGQVLRKYLAFPYVNSHFYWSFDYGPAHISVIDQFDTSYSAGSAQMNWLEDDLASSTKEWKFIIFHEPGYSAGHHGNDSTVQNSIQPLCVTYGVDIVFAGHNHNYARAVVNGVTHITTGGGGAPLSDVDTGMPYIVKAVKTLNFCKIDIQGYDLYFTAYKETGAVIESFVLQHTPSDTTPPAAPTGLAASGGSSQVYLNWNDNTEEDLSHYKVKRSTTSGSSYGVIANNVANSTYTDTGVTNGTTYYYVVSAVDTASNESSNSSEDSATPTYVPDTTPPAAPTGLDATAGYSQVSLDWNDNTEGDLSGYNVYRSTTTGSGYAKVNGSPVSSSAYNDNTVSNGTTYYYVVRAVDTSSNESGNSNEDSAKPDAGAGNLTGSLTDDAHCKKAVPTDNFGSEDYLQLRLTSSSQARVSFLKFNVTGSGSATSAMLKLYSIDHAGSVYVKQVSDTSWAEGSITWNNMPSMGSTIDTKTMSAGNWSEFDVTSYITGVGTYSFGIESSVDAPTRLDSKEGTNEAQLVIVSGGGDTTPPAAPSSLAATAGESQVSLDWNDNTEEDLDGYNVYRSTTSGSGYAKITGSRLSSSAYTDNTVANNTTYYYVVTAVDTADNESGNSNEDSAMPTDTTPPAAPAGLAAVPGDARVNLSWNDNTESDLAGYNVYRSTTSGSGFAKIDSLGPAPEYLDNTVSNDTTYYYKVTAVDATSNESAYSSEVNATPEAALDNPISPSEMVGLLKIGLATTWADSPNQHLYQYSTKKMNMIGAIGFKHIRFRTAYPTPDIFDFMDVQVQDCLDSGMVAVIACTSNDFAWENDPTQANEDVIVQWWEDIANHYKNYSHKVIFNLTVELKGSNVVSTDETATYLNSFIEAAVTAIRDTGGNNATRIIIMQPQTRGDPYKLHKLNIPTDANGYMMAEWHDGYASGPKPPPHPRSQWSDPPTDADKQLITDRIAAAEAWTSDTGILTWEGAWMPGNYNQGDDFTIEQQIEFVDFFAGELVKAGIPSCVNATTQFLDNDTEQWITERIPVRDELLEVYEGFGEVDTIPPAAPTGLAATAGDTVVSLNWNNNSEGDLSHYKVKRSTSTGGPYDVIDGNVPTSDYIDTGLTNDTTYYYIVKAVDTSNNVSSESNEASATPTSQGAGDLEASLTDDSLCKKHYPTDNFGSEDNLQLRVISSALARVSFLKFTVTGSGTVTSAILKLRSYNQDGSVSVKEVSNTSWTEGTITWNNMPSMGSTLDTESMSPSSWSEFDVTSYITGAGTYSFGLETSVDAAGKIDSKESANDPVLDITSTGVDTTPPAAPTGLAATPGHTQVSLDWNNNTESDLSHYMVKRSTTTGSPYDILDGNVSVSNYLDTGLVNGMTYYYVVTAVDESSNESGNSSEASATPADTTPPAAPTGLTASAGDGEVSLDWNDNYEDDLSHYKVKRATSTGGPYDLVNGNVALSSYVDTSVSNGTTYYYVVTAVDDSSNESVNSSEDSATPTGSGGGDLEATLTDDSYCKRAYPIDNFGSDDKLQLRLTSANHARVSFLKFSVTGSGSASSAILKLYSIDQDGPVSVKQVSNTSWTEGTITWNNMPSMGTTLDTKSMSSASWSSFDVTSYITGAGTYSFGLETSVDAVDTLCSKEGTNDPVLVIISDETTPPAAPTGLAATAGSGQVSLDWNDNTEIDLDGYNVYRSTTSGSGYLKLNGSLVSSSAYTDATVSNDTTYYYVVTAVDNVNNESSASNEDSATPSGIPAVASLTDDAHCKKNYPNDNFGSDDKLLLRLTSANMARVSFLKFVVTNAESVSSAILNLYSIDQVGSVSVKEVSNTSWTEGSITWNNMPSMGSTLDTETMSASSWSSFDVTSYITGNGTYSFGIETTVDDAKNLCSKEGSNDPELDITE